MVDAGLPWRELRRRAARIGARAESITTLLLSHEHTDHVRGLGPLLRRGIKVWASPGTLAALGIPGQPLSSPVDILGLTVRPFPLPHDAAEPLGFRFEANGAALGLATDLGSVPPDVLEALRGCQVVALEANHDLQLLLGGPYPWPLKLRIMGPRGHLGNHETGQTLAQLAQTGLRAALLAHLSRENNAPHLALDTVARALPDWEGKLYLTYPDRPSSVVGGGW